MIKIRIRNYDNEIDIHFPISENELYSKLNEIHAIEGRDAPKSAFVTDVYWPEEFTMLKDRFANLDELNYLAKRMESFDELEMSQFVIGASKLNVLTVKDLINLTFNLDKFTLVQDVSGYGKIGRAYMLNTEGSIPAHDEDNPKYVAIGKDLIDRGLTQMTERGLLIYNPFDVMREVYDGQTFPPYYDRADYLLAAEVNYGGRTELLLLPQEQLAIEKAFVRLGADSPDDCAIGLDSAALPDEWAEKMQGMLHTDGIYAVNTLLGVLQKAALDWEKLSAVTEMADAENAADIAFLAERLEDFEYLPRVRDKTELAHCLVDEVDEYELNQEMEDFFDFSGFGEYFAAEHNGQFIDGGFVYYTGDEDLEELLSQLHTEDEDIRIGGI